MRIAFGGIENESNNLLPVETPLDAFFGNTRGADTDALAKRSGSTNTVIDGFIRGLRDHGAEGVPLVWMNAPSGGQPSLETHNTLKDLLLKPLREALPLDGVLLSLHGAYSVQGLDDGDGDILKDVRDIVGHETPVISVHDPHCNIGPQMAENATAMIILDTYPHVDMAERALEATTMIIRTVRGEIRPSLAWCPIPLFWAAARMISAEEPMRTALEKVFQLEREAGVLTASLGLGFQWVDIPIAGASTVVVTNNDPAGAQEKTNELARWIWERKDIWQRDPVSPAEALAEGEKTDRYPTILADQADNPGGGAPSDNTEILRLFIKRDLQKAALLYMVDPEAVKKAKQAGIGQRVALEVGGRSHPSSGPPVRLEAEVLNLSDGHFVHDGPMFAHLPGNYGDSVLLKQRGIYVVVITQREQPIDLSFCRTLGLDCSQLSYIGVKSTGHFRSGFGPIAGSIFNVDASGVFTQDFSKIPFKRLGRRIYPINKDAMF